MIKMIEEKKLINYIILMILAGILIPVALIGWANQEFYDFYIVNKVVETKGSMELYPVEYTNESITAPSDPVESSINIMDNIILVSMQINKSLMEKHDSTVIEWAHVAVKNNENNDSTLFIYFCEAFWNETAGKMQPNISTLEKDREITLESNFDGVYSFIKYNSPINVGNYNINNNTLFVGINSSQNVEVKCTNKSVVGDFNNVYIYNQTLIEKNELNAAYNYSLIYSKILWNYNQSILLTPYPKLENETYREISLKITDFETEVLLNYTNFSLGSYLSNNISFTLKSSNPSVYESSIYSIPFENEFYSTLNVTIYRQYYLPAVEDMNITIYQKIYYQEFREKTELKTIFSLIPVMIILSLAGLFIWKREDIEEFIGKINK